MQIPPHLTQLQYGYDNNFTTIVFGLEDSCLGFILILLFHFLNLNSKNKIVNLKRLTKH